MLIDPTINFAAFQREAGKDMVMVGIFEDQQQSNQGQQQGGYQQPQQQQQSYQAPQTQYQDNNGNQQTQQQYNQNQQQHQN